MSKTVRQRLGYLGGSFDPVHLGHLLAANDACEFLSLDRVTFVPTAQSPLKDHPPGASAAQRLAMLQAGVAGDPRLAVSAVELDRGGVSYTVDTVRGLRQQHPSDELYWIIGADQASRLGQWLNIHELARLIEFIVLARPGFSVPAGGLPPSVRLHPVSAHTFDISASEIRDRARAGKSIRHFLPPAVAEIIVREKLYT